MRPLARLVRRAVLVVVLALAVAALDGCTNGVEEPTSDSSSSPTAGAEQVKELRVVSRVTRVAGYVSRDRRQQLAQGTGRLVTSYVTSALLDRERQPAWDGFTDGAARLARRDRDVLTLAGVDEDAQVEPRRVSAYVSVLAPHHKVRGATARIDIRLSVTRDGVSSPVHLSGRLLLTPTKKGLRVFGYDLQRSGEGA